MPALLHLEAAAAQLVRRLPNIHYFEHYARLRGWSVELQLHFVARMAGNIQKQERNAGRDQQAVFLCSPASDYIHGHIMAVDGGWLGR